MANTILVFVSVQGGSTEGVACNYSCAHAMLVGSSDRFQSH